MSPEPLRSLIDFPRFSNQITTLTLLAYSQLKILCLKPLREVLAGQFQLSGGPLSRTLDFTGFYLSFFLCSRSSLPISLISSPLSMYF